MAGTSRKFQERMPAVKQTRRTVGQPTDVEQREIAGSGLTGVLHLDPALEIH